MTQAEVKFEQAKREVIGTCRPRAGIGTLAEKTIHAVMKSYYAPDADSREIKVGRYVADIFADGRITEIQTRNFDKIRNKLAAFLPDYPVTVVYPIPREKYLFWIDETTGETSVPRKSPLHGTYYHACKELYKIKMYLKEKNLSIRLVLMDMDEYRLLNGWSRDRKKGSTRFDRIPKMIRGELELHTPADYRVFVPANLTEPFTTKEFAKAAHIPLRLAGTVINILKYMDVIRFVGKEGRSYRYVISA